MSYKRHELNLHNKSYVSLAKAVIRQWNMDGRPRGDEEGIVLWGELLDLHQQYLYSASDTYSLSGIRRKHNK